MVASWTIHFTIVLYIWAGDPIDQRSIFITYLGDSLISWWSKKQNVDFGSNTESKYCESRSNIQIAHNDVFTLSVIIFKTTLFLCSIPTIEQHNRYLHQSFIFCNAPKNLISFYY